MDRIRLLENPIRHYAWGSRTFLAQLQGRAPTSRPEAELWIGAHPSAPSQVVTDEGRVSLVEWIARDAQSVLGSQVAARFDSELPFLLKVLAVEAPLSLQVHPGSARAREGFEREQRAGIPLDAAERCYPDPHEKPELVCALTPFEALVGLRTPDDVRAVLEALDVPLARSCAERLGKAPAAEGLRETFAALLGASGPERAALVAKAVGAARSRPTDDPADAWCIRLAERWPDDPMVLAPYLLHHVRLEPGEALFVAPGTLHTYLGGAAVEVQAASDNVLRAGLTPKHVNVEALLSVAGFESGVPRRLSGSGDADACVYDSATPRFQLTSQALGSDERTGSAGVELVLCVEGRATLADSRGAALALGPGDAALVPAAAGPFRLAGPAQLFRVRTGPGP